MPSSDLAPQAGAAGPDSPRRRIVEAALMGALALTLNLAGNGRISLWDRDEPRYAGCTREMRASGDYIHPTFNAEPRYHKPILTYWLMLGGTALGGDNPFGARLVSSFMGMGTCLLVWALGRRMFGPLAGRLAALVLATAPIMVVESKLATTDATLMFFVTLSQWALWELAQAPSRRWAAVFWVSFALAVLTKGPAAPAILATASVVAWAAGGPVRGWARLHWRWGPAGFLALTAPWYIAIGIISRGEFYRVAMGKHVIYRLTTGMETHGGFPGYYVVGSLLGFYPWSALLPVAIFAAWAARKSQPALGFLLGWVVGPLILLECVRTKLIHYYLPAYAGCALLAGWLVASLARSGVGLRRWPLGRLANALLVGLGGGTALALLALALAAPPLRAACLTTVLVLSAGTAFAVDRFNRGLALPAAGGLAATWAAVLLLAGSWLLPEADPFRLSPIVARKLAEYEGRDGAQPMLASYQAPGVVYGFGRPVPVLEDRPWLYDLIRRKGAVVAALSKPEVDLLMKDRELTVEVREAIHGLDVERGKPATLHMALIRSAAPDASRLAGRRPEQPAVK